MNETILATVNGKAITSADVDAYLAGMGQRGQNYDALVPNAAVRNDSNGTFVLLMTTKNSPLGNRYAATRVDVKVLASDDNMSAVSGLGYGDYVITTSSKPVEPGDLVRIAEG